MSQPAPDVPHGYHGCYLRVDLDRGTAEYVPLPGRALRHFIGGSGLGTYLLLSENAALLPALAPESPLAFVFSPLVGSPLTTSAKFAVVSKGPLTDRLNDSLASSGFALAGKKTGCDAMLIVGRAAQPSIVVIDDGVVRIEPAHDLWGRTVDVTEDLLRQRFGGDYSSAVIGPAGERLVRYATISHDRRHAGRGGSGAVLGAKRIKAIVLRGTQRCTWAQPQALAELAKELSAKSLGPATAKYRELGTAANLAAMNRLGALPTRNFQAGQFAGGDDLAVESWGTARPKTRASCAACTIGCEHRYATRSGSHPGRRRDVRLEYQSLFALGALCGIGEADAVLAAAHRCDQLGMDTISLGGSVAFAMECVERGLLDVSWLRFGDGDALLRALELTASREDIGDRLAEGSRRLAEQVGGDSLAFAPQVKGLELPGYEPRALQTMALGLAVAARGADHNRSSAYEADFSGRADRRHLTAASAQRAIETEDRAAVMDSLILCKFLRGVFTDFFAEAAAMLRLVTGWDVTAAELHETAQRIVSAKKLFNIQAGWTPGEDTLPARFFEHPPPGAGMAPLTRASFAEAVRAYNAGRGWTAAGWLTPEQTAELTAFVRRS